MNSFVLASASPRRRDLLMQIGAQFVVQAADIDESVLDSEQPSVYVKRVSHDKALRVAALRPGEVVLAADTTVVLDEEILGKPESTTAATQMLMRLSGRTHQVLSAVTAIQDDVVRQKCVETQVTFRQLLSDEITWYCNTGEPFDKAGSYGLQGAGGAFVESISGSHSNVIGLPLVETVALLREFQVCVLHDSTMSLLEESS